MRNLIRIFKKCTLGATSIEYALIVGVIGFALLVAIEPLKEAVYGDQSGFNCIEQFLENGNRGNGVHLVNDGAGACGRFEDGTG